MTHVSDRPTSFADILTGILDCVSGTDLCLTERDDFGEVVELARKTGGDSSGRCRLRILRIREGKEAGKWAAFFYKPSAVPHCHDRYSYGAAVNQGPVDTSQVRSWIEYLESDFDPTRIPAGVRRALTFQLPDFEPRRTPAEAAQPLVGCPDGGELTRPLNPGELEVDLFCRGIRIDPSCTLESDARLLTRTRAGLGSGVELVIPGSLKDLWINVPVEEDFAARSPYRLIRLDGGEYRVVDERIPAGSGTSGGTEDLPTCGWQYPVRLPPEPRWYRERTRAGTLMSRVGVLQGTYLGIYLSNSCGFWYHQPEAGCQFCTTGLFVGVNEVAHKDVQDVVDVALAARRESGNTFIHLNSGFHGGDKDLDIVEPYVRALKQEVGALVGVQVVPSRNFEKYDRLIEAGVNHFSFCYEFHNPEYFARYLPGKARLIGQDAFFKAMEYCTRRLGRGSCSGEIIAGVEPIEDTKKAIDYITGVGAFPTVCIFRPTIGSAMERHPSPDTGEMLEVMRYMYEACRRNGIPIGMAPNIEVSLIVNPDDARYLVDRTWKVRLYEAKLSLLRMAARPYFALQLRPRGKPAQTTASPPRAPGSAW
jgi:hypothetical protein